MAPWRRRGHGAPSSLCALSFWVRPGPALSHVAAVLSVASEGGVMGECGYQVVLTPADARFALLMQVASCVNDWPFMGKRGAAVVCPVLGGSVSRTDGPLFDIVTVAKKPARNERSSETCALCRSVGRA